MKCLDEYRQSGQKGEGKKEEAGRWRLRSRRAEDLRAGPLCPLVLKPENTEAKGGWQGC